MPNLQLNLGPRSFADLAKSRLQPQKPQKTVYRFQETCAELSKLSGLPFGVTLALWKKHGLRIEQFLAEIKQNEVKNPKAYLLYLLKKTSL